MSRYSRPFMHPAAKPRPWKIHPIWRGIGCLLIFLLPIISFAGAMLLVRENFEQRWVDFPEEFTRLSVASPLGRLYLADVAVWIVLMILGFALLTLLYAFANRLFGPPRYGPLDMPPIRRPKR